MTKLIFALSLLTLNSFCLFTAVDAHADIWDTGASAGGLRDYREVMPGLLYRAGGPGGMHPLPQAQLDYLCREGMSTSYYLYTTGFRGPQTVSCGGHQMRYLQENWNGSGYLRIHHAIYNAARAGASGGGTAPVFIHCWNGIHATGFVSATALMQFCGVSASTAIEYWKVGIAKSIQYPAVIEKIRSFRPNPALMLSPSEQARFCPRM